MAQSLTLVQHAGRTLIRNPRLRQLGSFFPLARRSHLFWIPVCLMLSGFWCVVVQGDPSTVFGGFVATIASVYLLADLLLFEGPLRLSSVLAFTLGLGYGLGALNTYFTLPHGQETVGEFLGLSTPWISQAMGGLLLVMGLLIGLGELLEKPVFGEEFRLRFDSRAILIMTIGTLFRAAVIVSGRGGGFGSTTIAATGHIGVIATLAGDLQNPLFAFALCAALNARSRTLRIYLWGMTGVLFLTAFPGGRRVMIYSLLLGVIALRFGAYRLPWSTLKKVIIAVLMGVFLYFSTILFFYFRIAGYTLIHPTMKERVMAVIHLAETKKYSEIKIEFSRNVESRTFIVGFLSDVVGFSEQFPTAHGQDVLSQLELSIPSVFYPNKDVYFTEEQLASALFGQNWGDQPNSVLTTGAVDFGFLGLLVYPLLVVLMLRAFIEVCGNRIPPFAACFVIFLILGALLEPENDITDYFISMREGLLVGLGIAIFQYLPSFRLRDPRQ